MFGSASGLVCLRARPYFMRGKVPRIGGPKGTLPQRILAWKIILVRKLAVWVGACLGSGVCPRGVESLAQSSRSSSILESKPFRFFWRIGAHRSEGAEPLQIPKVPHRTQTCSCPEEGSSLSAPASPEDACPNIMSRSCTLGSCTCTAAGVPWRVSASAHSSRGLCDLQVQVSDNCCFCSSW